MIFSSSDLVLACRFGHKKACEIMMDAGYPAIDLSLDVPQSSTANSIVFGDNYKENAKELRELVNSKGGIFNQSHAPFGGGFEFYTTNTVPQLPRIFEFVSLLGVRQIVVHPVQNGRYYGHEKELFEYNVNFYKGLAPVAKEFGVKIAIENMWQRYPVSGHIVDDICADPHELANMFDTLDDPDAFTICLDIGHVPLCRREPQDAVRIIGHDRLGALHVHDVDYVNDCHTLPGMCKINWEEVCRALGEINYKGEFTLEADSFLTRYDNEFLPTAVRFMADTARHFSNKVDFYRK